MLGIYRTGNDPACSQFPRRQYLSVDMAKEKIAQRSFTTREEDIEILTSCRISSVQNIDLAETWKKWRSTLGQPGHLSICSCADRQSVIIRAAPSLLVHGTALLPVSIVFRTIIVEVTVIMVMVTVLRVKVVIVIIVSVL